MATAGSSSLSSGSIDQILERRDEEELQPLVQVLGTKVMSNHRIRAVIWDGNSMCQHCIFLSDEINDLYDEGKLAKFTVIRLLEYTVSSLPGREDLPVILVQKLDIVKSGEDVDRKLNAGESLDPKSAAQAAGSSRVGASSSSFYGSPLKANTSINSISNSPSKLRNVAHINEITPYFNAWTIRGRVMRKGELRTWSKPNSSGKFFNFDICDETSEIRITAFNDECDKFLNIIEQGKVYLFSKGEVKLCNPNFKSNLKSDYEITLNKGSIIELDQDNVSIAVPKVCFTFLPLNELNNTAEKTRIDVIGVIRYVGKSEKFTSKRTSKELTKRDIGIADKSLTEVSVTLWDKTGTDFPGETGDILAIKSAQVGEFNGKNLSVNQSSTIQLNPDIPESTVLRSWYETQGANQSFTCLSRPLEPRSSVAKNTAYICQINQMVSRANGPLYFNVSGIIEKPNRSNSPLYKGCGFNGCKKKVVDEEANGLYRCSKCNRSVPTFQWVMMLSIKIADTTGSCWLTLFQNEAEKLLGKSTSELAELYERDEHLYAQVVNGVWFKQYHFRAGARIEEYQNEKRVKVTGYEVKPLAENPVDRAKRLFAIIDTLSGQLGA